MSELNQSQDIEFDNTGVRVVQELDYETWGEYIHQILDRKRQAHDYVERVSMWMIGDLYLYGENVFGEDEAIQIVDDYSAETIRKAKWVAKLIPRDERDPSLSFTHHEIVAKQDPEERQALLEYARDEQLSSYELKKYMRKAPKGRGSGKAAGNPPQGSVMDPPESDEEEDQEPEQGKCPFCGERAALDMFRR